ncbi:MAG TPA: precorrin-3B C(17)-methyltransferase [Chloroflexota bacterium]
MASARGKVFVVGLGPGSNDLLTPQARAAIGASDTVAGYRTYLELIPELLAGKAVLASGMMQEVARVSTAIEAARSGKTVAVVCSGDPGIYGMAGLVYEVLREQGWRRDTGIEVEIVPGIAALNGAAALLGAPLMHDFAAISLSDLLTPWETIVRRIDLAAQADFVIGLYNPRSRKRVRELEEAVEILRRYRAPETPVGVVRHAYRDEQSVVLTDLAHLLEQDVDMVTLVLVGNSATLSFEGVMVTPRGYGSKYDLGRDA